MRRPEEMAAEHFLTVASYNLQHPMTFTADAIEGLRTAYVEYSQSGPFAVSADGAGHFMGTCPACDVPFTITGSNDNGATWHPEPIPALQGSGPFAITFADANRGWIVGSQGGQGIILRTTDGGKTWTQP